MDEKYASKCALITAIVVSFLLSGICNFAIDSIVSGKICKIGITYRNLSHTRRLDILLEILNFK